MANEPVAIKRYPNRRYYSRNASRYVSLHEIEALILEGNTVEIRDSQTGEDLTRIVLTQIILERQPEKMQLFPTDMLHYIVQSNEMMSGFLRDYFQHSLTYLQYLRQHNTSPATLMQPMHWIKAWLDGISPVSRSSQSAPKNATKPPQGISNDEAPSNADGMAEPVAAEPSGASSAELALRIEQLEQRLRQLENPNADR